MKNVTSRVQTALATAINITGISKAAEAVVTAANTLTAGDYVVIKSVQGMVEINERVVRVKSPSSTDFTCEGLDSSGFSTYTSAGTIEKVSSWATFDNISSLNFSDNPAQKVDTTPINAASIKEINGLKGAPSASFGIFSDPLGTAVAALRAASDDGDPRVFEFIFNDEGFTVFCNAEVSGGNGLNGSPGAAVSGGEVQLTLKHIQQYVAT